MWHGIIVGVVVLAACGGKHGGSGPPGPDASADSTVPSVTIASVTVAGEACAPTMGCDCLVYAGDAVAFEVDASDQDGIASLGYQSALANGATTPPGAPASTSSQFTFDVPANVTTQTVQLVATATDPAANTGMSVPVRLCAAPLPVQRKPVVVWEDWSSGTVEVYLKRWNGSAWEELGGSASAGGISQASGAQTVVWPILAVGPDGNPVVAWSTRPSGPGSTADIYLKKWNGSAWIELGGSASGGGVSAATGLGAQEASVAIDSTGQIYVAWEAAGAPPIYTYVKRWNGTAWEELAGSATGTGLSGQTDAAEPYIAIDPQDRPIVAWNQEIGSTGCWVWARRWNGTSWEELAGSASGAGIGGVNGASDPAIAFDHDGNPVVGWQGNTSDGVVAMRWDGTSWSAIGDAPTTASSCSAGWHYQIAFDARDRAAIADFNGRVQRWNGTAWTTIATDDNAGTQPHGFAPDGRGFVIAWADGLAMYLRRWNGAAWEELGGSASGNGLASGVGSVALANVATY